MPDVKQYSFSMQEVAEILHEKLGSPEGKWTIGINFGINVGDFGPTDAQARPGLIALVDQINISIVDSPHNPGQIIVGQTEEAAKG